MHIVVNLSEERDFLKDMSVAYIVFRMLPDDIVYVYANEAGARLEGHAREDLIGRSLFDVFPEVDATMRTAFEATARDGLERSFTARIPGERYLSVRTYRPEDGFCACVLDDVTEWVQLEAAREEERRRLEHRATRDPLTGLWNVREGRASAERALASPRWKGARAALFMFDLDDFKQVNDEFGHDRGDAVLKGFARVLERSFRCSDIVYRAGGDEFSAFVPDIPCACVAERICADVVASVEEMAAASIGVTVSIGVAVGRPTHSFEAFYRAADQALYGIKRTGKSSYRIADMDDVRARDVQGPAAPCDDEEGDREPEARTLPAA